MKRSNSSRRAERLGEAIKQEVSKVILHKLKDPRLSFITVTNVDISPDLKKVKIFISVLGDEAAQELTLKGLERAKGFVQAEIGAHLRIKYTPHLEFCLDESEKKRMRILKIIDNVV